MQYYSTNSPNRFVSLQEAIMRSIAPDTGVYMPHSIPLIPRALFKNIHEMSLTDIAYVVGTTLFGSDVEAEYINNIVRETLTFDIPLVEFDDNTYALELFHGPTGSFKDVGARFMGRMLQYFLERQGLPKGKDPRVNVLVATSGDTGCAVAQGLADIPGVRVFIFHPKGKMLRVPGETLRSTSPNIIPVAIRGTFDDCQNLVRQAYRDEELNRRINLTSANSINIARLLPQTFYFFYAYSRVLALAPDTKKIAISTPCGNLGNLTAAFFSKQLGLPVNRIIAAGHGQERLWGEMHDGRLKVNDFNSKALSTNLARINSLFTHNPDLIDILECITVDDSEFETTILKMYRQYGYLMDRNTSMACYALNKCKSPDETGIFLATAHPYKYRDKLKELIGAEFNKYPETKEIFTITPTDIKAKRDISLPALYPVLKRFLLENQQ